MSSETVGIKHSDLVEVSGQVVGFEHEAESHKLRICCPPAAST